MTDLSHRVKSFYQKRLLPAEMVSSSALRTLSPIAQSKMGHAKRQNSQWCRACTLECPWEHGTEALHLLPCMDSLPQRMSDVHGCMGMSHP